MSTLVGLIVVLIVMIKIKQSISNSFNGMQSDITTIKGSLSEIKATLYDIKERIDGSSQSPGSVLLEPKKRPVTTAHQTPELSELISYNEPTLPMQVTNLHLSIDSEPQTHLEELPLPAKELVHDTYSVPKPQIIEDIRQILSKLWNWIIVGEDHRPANISMEYAVASTWLLRIGIIALVACVGYFLSWSIDKGILGHSGRVALAVLAGVGLILFGIKNLHSKYRLLAEGFLGGGLAFLYFSTYASGPMYHLVPLPISFVLMSLVTLTAGALSARIGSQLVAILGIIGGFATPVILSSDESNIIFLYSYLLLLGLGVLGIAHLRQWRILNYLAFVFTWAIFFGSLDQYNPKQDFTVAILFLSALFALHSIIIYYYNLFRKKSSTSLEIIHLLLNSTLFSATSYNLIIVAHGKPWPAVMAVAMALFFILHIYLFLKERQHDRNILIVFIGLAGFFTAWAVPLITEKETLTICWALLAFFILWIGLKLKSNMLIKLSSILYLIVVGRLLIGDIPRNFNTLDWSNRPVENYLREFLNRIWVFGIVIGSLFGAFGLFRYKEKNPSRFIIDDENNTPLPLSRQSLMLTTFWCGIALLFTIVYLEFMQMFSYHTSLRTPILSSMWVGLGLFLLFEYKNKRNTVYLTVSIVLLLISLGKLFLFDFASWGYISNDWIYQSGGFSKLMRLLNFGVIFIFIMFLTKATQGIRSAVDVEKVFIVVGAALLFLYLTLEVNTLFHWFLPLFQTGSISVLWAFFAMFYLAFGLRKNSKSWRYSGLILFAIVVLKIFLIDLAGMATIYRVISSMVIGLLLIAGAYAYIKADKKFISTEIEI